MEQRWVRRLVLARVIGKAVEKDVQEAKLLGLGGEGEGRGCLWCFPLAKEVSEGGDCMKLRVAGGGRSVGDGIGDGVQAVDNGVGRCYGWDGEVVVTKVNCVRDAESFGL